ncbi:hypothetical protein ES706_03218 [subsurface metagenome]
MKYKIVPFTQNYLEPAVNLFINGYRDEQEKNPLLPSRAINEPEWILNTLKSLVTNPGVVICKGNQVIAYMVTGFLFPFKGQNAVLVPEYCHGSVLTDRKELYQRMYMYLADEWAKNRRHLHIVGHFAHDFILQETLYQLGFGAILVERVRDFSAVNKINEVKITEEKNFKKLIDIDIEHSRYYPNAPIFIWKDTERKAVISGLESHSNNGDAFFVYYEQNKPCAYIIVGTSTIGAEGFLLQKTNTAQIKAAYAQPHVQGKGIGKALLQRAVQWSQEHGYERLFVEHETSNYYGGNFWCKHFNPYVYFSLRYIDNTIDY